MRASCLLLAVLVLGAGWAGCLGTADPADPTPGTPSPAPAPSPEPSPEPTPSSPPPPEPTVPSGSPIPPAPKVVYNESFDFSTEGDPTGQSPRLRQSARVGEEYGLIEINISIVRSSAAPTGLPVSGTINAPRVRVLDPSGNEVLTESAEGTQRTATFPALVGVYTVRYEGAGTLRATVILTAAS